MAEVSVSKRYEIAADDMWSRIGDPGSLGSWHPGVETTEVIDDGHLRINTLPGGAKVVEPIMERGRSHYTFQIADSSLPLRDFISTIRVRAGNGAGPAPSTGTQCSNPMACLSRRPSKWSAGSSRRVSMRSNER